MSGSRILAVARRIAQGFRRDERTLGLVFVVPIAITLLLGWVIRDSEAGEVRIAVVAAEGAPIAGTSIASSVKPMSRSTWSVAKMPNPIP